MFLLSLIYNYYIFISFNEIKLDQNILYYCFYVYFFFLYKYISRNIKVIFPNVIRTNNMRVYDAIAIGWTIAVTRIR